MRQILEGRRFERAALAVLRCPEGQMAPEWAQDVVMPVVIRLHEKEMAARAAAEGAPVAQLGDGDGANNG